MPSFSPEIVEVPYYARYWSFSSDRFEVRLLGEGSGKHWTNKDFTKALDGKMMKHARNLWGNLWGNLEMDAPVLRTLRSNCEAEYWKDYQYISWQYIIIIIIIIHLYIHVCIYMYINCKAHHRAPPARANGREATLQEITSVSTSIWCATCNLPGTSIYEVSSDAPMYIFSDSFCPFIASMCTYLIHNPWRCVVWNHEFSGWKGKHQL